MCQNFTPVEVGSLSHYLQVFFTSKVVQSPESLVKAVLVMSFTSNPSRSGCLRERRFGQQGTWGGQFLYNEKVRDCKGR